MFCRSRSDGKCDPKNLKEIELKAKLVMANVQVTLERNNADVNRDVAQCAAFLRNRLEKLKEASSTTEAHTDVSTGQHAGPCSASKS